MSRLTVTGLIAGLLVAPTAAAGGNIDSWALDGRARAYALDAPSSQRVHASLQRTPPAPAPTDPSAAHGDPDALQYLLVGSRDDLPSVVDVASLAADGRVIDRLSDVALSATPCPAAVSKSKAQKSKAQKSKAQKSKASRTACATTAPVRAVSDSVDAEHPLVRARSLRAELGGTLVVSANNGELGRVRVAGPRNTKLGTIERYRAKLRFHMVRLAPRGDVPVGGNRKGAIAVARAAVERVNALWGACGIQFGPVREPAVSIVDPPPPHMLVLGCDHGLPASGGTIRFRVNGRALATTIHAGNLPNEAARRVAATLRRAGFEVRISDNPRMAAGAYGSTDLSVRGPRGKLATLAMPRRQPLSDDPTLTVCIGRVSLEDGLQHFSDVDAIVGTVEERTLIKAYDDGDPTTVDVYMVPGFALGGRIGESFIGADGGSLRNVVVVDRAGIRSNRASFTLAHELGHVLLDDPGHPDDFGIDTPTLLMDADASDVSAFGPRRLTIAECERAIRQSGPSAPVQLLRPWPLKPVGN